ncbi:S-adenosyl-L-methionine-dependent methyltransferase [Pleomassaria siparia CBS 279.74]|uniref:S-adenosyl-L-methionine-dependent methyltransferase n=1 Tax=Pleomassaria siparia CBS 279.74 TaxID=1314801 RepID=A0A6G1JT78_9PLEO|nr:S-adenosyl-L-methionine-dependent methyltransferase [Pleomassaria siparia CBS 279.74]
MSSSHASSNAPVPALAPAPPAVDTTAATTTTNTAPQDVPTHGQPAPPIVALADTSSSHPQVQTLDESSQTQTQPQTHGEPTLAEAQAAHDATVIGQNLEPDSNHSDTDSAFGSDGNSSSSTSLASSIMNYEYSNGRRYHGYRSGAYPLPNDDEEQDRLDLLHHIFLLMLGGKLSNVPFTRPPQRVLDIGTGTGIWAIDYADENPEASILGTDLSPIQPTWVPPNAKFYIDDAESDWVYQPDEHFDYIHVRGMSGSIGDWDRLCAQAYAHTVPGGWVEFQEPEAWVRSDDDTITQAENIQLWQQLVNDAADVFKKEIRIADTLKQKMENAGFVDVSERIVKVPVGPWPKDAKMKEIGRYQREHMAMGIEPYTFGFIGKILGWSEQECKVIIAKVINEVRDRNLHLYIQFFFVVGRKPGDATY